MGLVQKGYRTVLRWRSTLGSTHGRSYGRPYGPAWSSYPSYGGDIMPGDTNHVLSGGSGGMRHLGLVSGQALTRSLPPIYNSQHACAAFPIVVPGCMGRARSPQRALTAGALGAITGLSRRGYQRSGRLHDSRPLPLSLPSHRLPEALITGLFEESFRRVLKCPDRHITSPRFLTVSPRSRRNGRYDARRSIRFGFSVAQWRALVC